MLAKHKLVTPIAVHDIENAVDFYENTLGLERVEKNLAGFVFGVGDSWIGLHESPTAGSGQSTCAWWIVDDVEGIVHELKRRGVTFDKNYDLPNAEKEGDVYILGDTQKAAWFRDPDGNILGIGNF